MARAPESSTFARDPEVAKAQNRVDANRLTQTGMQMDPSEDFSPEASARRETARGYQEMAEWQKLQAQAAEADKQFNGPLKNSAGANPAGGYRERAAALVAYSVSRRQGVIQRYPTLQRALVEAVAAGADVTEQDILRLTNYAEADRAATAYMNAPLESQRKNILLSMSPVQRAATLDVVAQKAADLAMQLETSDTNWLQAGLGAVVGAVLEPFVWANEGAQHTYRALGVDMTGNDAVENAVWNNPLGPLSNWSERWDATETGQFDETYIQTLRDSGQYSPLAVDIVTEISKKQAEGDPDPLISVIADPKYAGNAEADLIFRGLIYRPDEDENLMELVRQVDSANRGSTGQLVFSSNFTPDSTQYSEFRGTKGRETGSNAASVFYAFALDPTIAGAKVVGAYRAARYALTKLAPAAKGGAAAALRSQKVAGVETNAARKAVQSFVDDLVKYDDLVARDPAKAATLRTVIARQHKEFPEDVIDEFQKQGIRTVDDFAAFVDETNDAFLLSRGEPTLAATAVTRAGESNFAREPLAMRMSARGDMGRREALMPRSGPVKRLRQTAVQRISAVFAPQARGRQTIDNFYGNTDDVEQVTQRLGENALDAGMADQSQALLGKGALGRRVDGFTRLFSSLSSVNHITTFDARDAGQFYKFARTYLTRQNATFLTNAFRDGNPAQRRLMVAGLIRTSAAARGVSLSKGEALAGIDDLATGWRVGERYSATRQLRATPDVADDTVTVHHYGNMTQFGDTPPKNALGNIQGPGLYTSTDEAYIAQHSASRTDGAMTSFSVPKSVVAERTLDMAAPVDARARRIAAAMEEAFVREVGSPSGVEFPAYAPTFMVARISLVDDYARALRKARGVDDFTAQSALDDISFDAQIMWANAVKGQGYAGTRLARDGGDEIMWLEDPRSFAAASKTPEQIVEDTIQYRPSNFDGEEHALHLWQTTQAVAIPSIRDMEALKRYRELFPFNLADGALTRVPQQATDFWSAWTLAGLRFSVRSAVEDLWVYAVTKGSMPFLYAGRRASTGTREARAGLALKRYKRDTGRHKKGELVLDADGNATVVVQSRLGMFGKRARKAGDSLAAASPENKLADVLGTFFLQNLDENAVIAAQAAARGGDLVPLQRLVVQAIGRTRLNGMTDEQLSQVGDLILTPFGMKQLDDVAEAGQFLNRGTLPQADDTAAIDIEGMTSVKIPERQATVLGGFKDVSGDDWRFGTFWFNSLEGIVSHDGPIGKIAVANLYNRDQAIARIADAIRSDTKFGYQTQFSALYTGKATVEQFAARYYDDVRNMFSGPDGSINAKLFERLAPKDADGVRQVGLHDIGEDGERALRITPNGMGAFRKDGAPEIVLGRESIPAPTEDLGSYISGDRMFTWMGEQYARISKEPLFIANYLEQRGINKAYQAQLAERIGEKAANKIVAKMSADRAYGFVLSYTDNPANRSQLAWKVRNVSRYYRATEDFYRRMQRVAKNYPEAFWKTALTYDVLDDTGFVFTDDNGDKYFAYPGNEFLQGAVTTALGGVFGMGDMGIDPYFIGGKVKMLAPSTDPNQAFPQMMGPIGVIPMKMLFDKFPAIKGFERYVLGEYSAQSEWWDAMFPGQVARILGMLTVDERESLYGSAIKDALAIAVSQDLLKDKSFDQDGITSTDQLLQGNMEEWRLLQKIAMGGIATKALMGFFPVPASPQLYVDNVTLFARAHGLDNMRDGFLDSVAVFEAQGSANPFGDAIAKWWALHPEGDLMPFTVSKTGKAEGKINALADVQSVEGLQSWWKDNKELYREFPNAALFLAPRTGDFSWGAYDLVTSTLGLRVGKDFDTFAMDVLVADDQSSYFATYDDYQRDIDALNPATDGEKIKQLQDERSADLEYLKSNNPLLARAMKQDWDALDQNAQEIYNQTKQMTQAMFDRGTATAVSTGIANAIATYEDYMSDITAISGSTDAEDEYKRNLKLGLEADLAALSGKDENVAHFVDTVLKRTPEFQKAAG